LQNCFRKKLQICPYTKDPRVYLYKNFLHLIMLQNNVEKLIIADRLNVSLPYQELNVIKAINKLPTSVKR